MNAINLDRTKDTPSVILDVDKNVFQIIGKSLPENAMVFYKPLYDWIVQYCEKYNDKGIEFNVDLEYLNSSSIKLVFLLFNKIDEYYSNTNAKDKTCINWKYRVEDELIKMKGEEFKEYLNLPFNLILID